MDKTWQEYLAEIKNRTSNDYPVVVKVSDPLLIRFNEKSLVVNNTNFYTNIKSGLAFEGFYIYTSGLGIPIAEIGQAPKNKKDSRGNVVVDGQAAAELGKKAKEFLDVLEAKIATTENDNEIKKAIDRLCWQMHYDISKTDTTELPEGFYPDIQIDKKSTISDYCDTVSDRIANFSTDGGRVPDATLSCAMNKIAVNLRADPETVGDITYTEYTVSRALRDIHGDNELSVSGATKARTEVEEAEFHEISVNQLGAFGSTYGEAGAEHQTLYEALGAYGGHDATPLSENINEINNIKLGDLGTVSGVRSNKTLCDIVGSYSNSSSTKTISTELDKIGDPSLVYSDQTYTADTLFGRLGNAVDGNAQTPVNSVIYQVLHRAGTRNLNTANIDADSPIGLVRSDIASVGSDVSSISSDTTSIKSSIGSASTSSTLWYDVIHNAGTGTPGTTAQTNSLQSKVQSVIDTIGSSTTSGTLYYDVLYNAGIKETSANVDANSLQGRIQNIQNVLGQKKTGVNLDAMTYLDYLYNNV